jgi:hypothetical protein
LLTKLAEIYQKNSHHDIKSIGLARMVKINNLKSLQRFTDPWGRKSSDFSALGGKITVSNAPARCCNLALEAFTIK